MPLTSKGAEIKKAMEEKYGKEKGEEVFYASKNKGTITGVDSALTNLPESVSPQQIAERNKQYWEQPGGQTFKNE